MTCGGVVEGVREVAIVEQMGLGQCGRPNHPHAFTRYAQAWSYPLPVFTGYGGSGWGTRRTPWVRSNTVNFFLITVHLCSFLSCFGY